MSTPNNDPMMSKHTALTAGTAALLTTTLLIACGPSKSETQEFSDHLPKWADGSHNICAVELGGRYDSLASVDTELTKDDAGFKGRSVLISAQPGHIGQVVNLNISPRTDQQPGDMVLAADVSAAACRQAGGEYDAYPQIVAAPSDVTVE